MGISYSFVDYSDFIADGNPLADACPLDANPRIGLEIVNKEGSAVVKDYCNIMSDWQSSESKDKINGFYCTEKKSITWVSAKNKSDKNEKYYLHPDRYYICRDLPDNTPPGSQRGACEVFLMRRGYV